MARKPMVTRTFEVTELVLMVCNTTTASVEDMNFTISRTYTDADKLLKAVRESVETATLKVVTIKEKKIVSKLYGMSENDFLKYAIELDPTTRKALEIDEDEQDEDEQDEDEQDESENK